MLPARLDERDPTGFDPHRYGGAQLLSSRRGIRPTSSRPRDLGQMGDNWRNILLDQLRQRGTNFFGI